MIEFAAWLQKIFFRTVRARQMKSIEEPEELFGLRFAAPDVNRRSPLGQERNIARLVCRFFFIKRLPPSFIHEKSSSQCSAPGASSDTSNPSTVSPTGVEAVNTALELRVCCSARRLNMSASGLWLDTTSSHGSHAICGGLHFVRPALLPTFPGLRHSLTPATSSSLSSLHIFPVQHAP
jgi:hypothetical protein